MTDHDGGDSPYDDFLAKAWGRKEEKQEQVVGDGAGDDDSDADSTGGFGGEETESFGDRAKKIFDQGKEKIGQAFDQGKEKVGQAYNTGKEKVEGYRQAKRDKVDQERMDQFHTHDQEARERETQEQKAREESGESGRYEDRTTRGEETDAGGKARKKEADTDNEKFAREKWEAARQARLEELQNNPELFDDDPLGDDRSYGIVQNEDGTFGLDDTVNPWARTDEDAEQEAREKRKAEAEEQVEEGENPFDEPEEQETQEEQTGGQDGVPGQDGTPGEQEQPQDTIYQDPRAQEIYAQHAKKFLQGAGQTLVENWGEGVSKGWDMAQNLVKMTLTQPSAMSSASRLIGMNLAALQTASDFQDKASARYNINVNADPKLVQDTLRYKLYKRDMQQGGQIVGNTFRTIAQSLSRYGGDMSNMSPSELSGHMRDMQGEKDRLLAALAEPNLKPSDRRLLTAQAQHLQSYMSGIAKQARSLQAQQAETNRFLKNEDYQRRMRAYDTLPTGAANPFSAVLHEASPKGNLEVDPDTGMPRYTAGLNAAMKTIDSMIQRIGADGSMSPDEKQAKIAELKNLYAQMGQKLVRMRQEGNRARVQDYGAWAQKLAENNPVLANNMGERMGAIFERGEYPIDATSLRRILAEVDRMRQSSDPEEKAAGDMFYADIVGFSTMNKTVTMLNNFAKDSLRGDEAAKMHNTRAKELNNLLDRMKAIPRPEGMEGAVYDAALRRLEGQARLETMMANSFSNPAAIGNDDRAIRAAQKRFHDRVFEATRSGEPFDINSPAFQEAFREYNSAVRKLAYKYEGKGVDEGWLNDVRRFVAQNGGDEEDDTGGDDTGGAGGGPNPNDDQVPPNDDEVPPGGEGQDDEIPPGGEDQIPPGGEDQIPPGGEGGGDQIPPGGDQDDQVPPGGAGGDNGKPKPKTKKQVRMEAVVSGILNEGETMSDEDRAVIEQMYDNGLFKFNGDDTLKDPTSLFPATRKTLVGKIDGILAQEDLSDRARELITEYRNALAGLDEKKEKDGEKGDDRIDPNEYFSKPPEDIVKDLMDRGVLIDKDGKVQFTMADADIKKTAKAFGMSVANFKKAVTKALKGTNGAGAGGAGGDSGGDDNDAGGLRPDYNTLNGLGNLGQNPQSGDIYNVLGRAFGAKASKVQGELEGPLADMMKDAKDETDAMVKAKDFVLQHFGNHALTENQRNTLTTLASVLGKNAWAAYKSNQGSGAGGNPGGETGGPNPGGEQGGENTGGKEQGETPITWPDNGNKKAKLAAINDAIKRYDENSDTKTDLVDMYRKAAADPKMKAYLKNKEFIELKKRAEAQAKARGETLETPPPGGQDEKRGEKPKDATVEKAYESLRQNMGRWNGGRAAREKGEVETYTSLADFTREAGNDLLVLTKNQKGGKKDTEYENAVRFVEDMFFNEYTGFRNNYLSFQKQYEIGKASGLSDDDENQKNLLRKMNTIKNSYNTFKQILGLDPNNAGARFDSFDKAFNPVGGKRSEYGGEEDKEREEREKLHEKINDRNDLKNFSYDDLWNEIKDIPANSPKKRRESWVRLLTKLQGDDLSDDVEKDGARVMGSKRAAANLRSMLFTKDGKLIKNFQSLPEDEKKTFDALMEKYHLPKVFSTNTDNGGPAP